MTYRGTVKNGVVILEPDAKLPEGTPVRVELEPAQPQAGEAALPAPEDDPLWNLTKFAGETGIPDLSVNVDHYLYGHPKVVEIPKLKDGD
jgi:hypothetical protein